MPSIESKNENTRSVGIQVVCFKSDIFLESLINSIFNLDYKEDKINVAFFINHSTGGETNLISLLWEKCQIKWDKKINFFIKESVTNIGFGRAHNYLALNFHKKMDLILILNPDTHLFYDSLKRAEIKMLSDPDIGAIDFMHFPMEHPKEYDDYSLETAWCSAACVLYRNKIFQNLGGFDENIFLYCEDIDLSWRIWLSNHKCILYPLAKCIHFTGNLNKNKKKSVETFWGIVSSAYIRWKYFDEICVKNYFETISIYHPKFVINRAKKEFYKIINNITKEQLEYIKVLREKAKYNKYIKLYEDLNFAKHRW